MYLVILFHSRIALWNAPSHFWGGLCISGKVSRSVTTIILLLWDLLALFLLTLTTEKLDWEYVAFSIIHVFPSIFTQITFLLRVLQTINSLILIFNLDFDFRVLISIFTILQSLKYKCQSYSSSECTTNHCLISNCYFHSRGFCKWIHYFH